MPTTMAPASHTSAYRSNAPLGVGVVLGTKSATRAAATTGTDKDHRMRRAEGPSMSDPRARATTVESAAASASSASTAHEAERGRALQLSRRPAWYAMNATQPAPIASTAPSARGFGSFLASRGASVSTRARSDAGRLAAGGGGSFSGFTGPPLRPER